MAVETQTELLAALEKCDFDRILGTAESSWLDFKSKQYDCDPGNIRQLSRKGKFELAKDVSAMANDNGGIILIGVEEKRDARTSASVASRLTPVKPSNIDIVHYQQVITSRVYPPVEAVRLVWYFADKAPSTNVGYLAIIIPKGNGGMHIVSDALDDDNPLAGITIAKRYNDQTQIYSAAQVYELFRKPSDNSAGGIDVSEAKNNAPVHGLKLDDKHGRQVREYFVASLEWEDLPVMTIQTLPIAGPDRLRDFYSEIEIKFRDTKPIRRMGFNLNSFGYETTTVDGAFVKSGLRDSAIRLDPEGMLTMSISGSDDFLGWGVNKDTFSDRVIKINSIVLLEVVFEYVRFIYETLSKHGLEDWKYVIDIRRFKEYNLMLYRGGPSSFDSYDMKPASSNDYLKVLSRTDNLESDTYRILEEIYALFSLPDSAIPYVADKRVTSKNIRDLDKNFLGR